MESVKELIGRHQYANFKRQKNLTEEQKKQVKAYEDKRGLSKEAIRKNHEYFERIRREKEQPKPQPKDIGKEELHNLFMEKFKETTGRDYEMTPDSIENLKILNFYFRKDPIFFECENLKTEINIGGDTRKCTPSFDKGLLIVGGYGNGKTSMMKAFKEVFIHTPFAFQCYSANSVVEDYENCENVGEKKYFWQKMNGKRTFFDDVKTERIASNYGKANLFKDVIEKRYENKRTTYMTCNYKTSMPNNLSAAVLEFGEKYGGRVLDRVFEMFNIVEFKGKSFRS